MALGPLLPRQAGTWLFLLLAAGVTVAAFFVPRVDLPPSYHHFADQRGFLGIPNFGDVASNLAFFIAGLLGFAFLSRKSSREQFVDARERWPYLFVFLGLLLTALGSAYYHFAPDNDRLVWDRLPMTIVFMPLVAAMITERANFKLGLWLLPVLTAVGIGSVIQWHFTLQHGAGDLRFYGAVQVYATLALVAALLLPSRYTGTADLIWVIVFYAIAKVAELADRQIFSLGHIISGHTIKHLFAAASGFWILRMLQERKPIPNYETR
jgi:hypothetical protein